MILQNPLETDRLILRPYIPSGQLATDRLNGYGYEANPNQELTLVMINRSTGQLVGSITLEIDKQKNQGEMRFWVEYDCIDKEYHIEAAQAVIQLGLENMELNRIYTILDPVTENAITTLNRIGLSHDITYKDGYEYVQVFDILRSQYVLDE